jgi:hypothetical protein
VSAPQRPWPPLQPRRRKYGGTLCTDSNGVLYDSQLERRRALELKILFEHGEITWWSWGPRYVLVDATVDERTGKRTAAVTYRPDFVVLEKGVLRVEDTKGLKTQMFMLKQKLWKARYPNVELRVIK